VGGEVREKRGDEVNRAMGKKAKDIKMNLYVSQLVEVQFK
jgi:hypothetical protein